MKKKIILTTALAGVIALGSIAAIGCNNGGSSNKGSDGVFALNSAKEVYAYSAASAVSLAADLGVVQAKQGISFLSDVTPTDYTQYVDLVNNYMAIAENMLTTNGGFSMTEQQSDNAEYEFKTEITYKDMLGGSSVYNMYYNKTMELPDSDDDDDSDDAGEVEYDINGILMAGDSVYKIMGTHESEEGETELQMAVKLDDNNYIVVEQEIEQGEVGYSYAVYKNGQLIEETTFEHETEDGEKEIEIKILKDGQVKVFELEEKTNKNNKYIEGIVIDGSQSFNFTIKVVAGENGEDAYEYTFEDKTYKKSRYSDDD